MYGRCKKAYSENEELASWNHSGRSG